MSNYSGEKGVCVCVCEVFFFFWFVFGIADVLVIFFKDVSVIPTCAIFLTEGGEK